MVRYSSAVAHFLYRTRNICNWETFFDKLTLSIMSQDLNYLHIKVVEWFKR